MFLRVVGLTLLLLGAVLVVAGGYGFYRTDAMTVLAVAANRDVIWASHWSTFSVFVGIFGVALAVAGLLCWKGRRYGLFVLAAAVVAELLLGVVVNATGYARYPFEVTGVADVAISLMVAAAAVLGFFRVSHQQ